MVGGNPVQWLAVHKFPRQRPPFLQVVKSTNINPLIYFNFKLRKWQYSFIMISDILGAKIKIRIFVDML